MLNIHKKAFNTILLVLILILIIMTVSCMPFQDTIEHYANQDRLEIETRMEDGNENYMTGITKITDLDNKLIGARQALLDNSISLDSTDSTDSANETSSLRSFPIAGAMNFSLVHKNPNNLGDINETDTMYYLNSSNKLFKFALNDDDNTFREMMNIDSSAFEGQVPVTMKYIHGDITNMLLCITDQSKLMTLSFNSDGTITSPWISDGRQNIVDMIIHRDNYYLITDEGKLVFYDSDYNTDFGPTNVKFIAIALDKKMNKLYALSTKVGNSDQSIYVFDFNDILNQGSKNKQPTYSKFAISSFENSSYHKLAIDIGNSYMNDKNNNVYLISGSSLYEVSLTYNDNTTSKNLSKAKLIIDTNTLISDIQIDHMNNEIYIYSPNKYFTYPLHTINGINLAQNTYKNTQNAVVSTNENMNELREDMKHTNNTIQTLNTDFNDKKTILNSKIKELNNVNGKLHDAQNDIHLGTGITQDQSLQYNMVLIKYFFWILTAIITIILLGLNYFAPDIITIEMIIVFAALMMFAVYLNRQYFGKYLDPIFSKLNSGFSSAISPLFSN
jgi:hypothetical protein